jgi:hypothetical protein
MVNRCANPVCRTEFRLLNSGDLYAIEEPNGTTEFVWICSNCASRFSLYLDPAGIVSLEPRGGRQQAHSPQLKASLRLAAHARHYLPWRHAIPASARLLHQHSGNWGKSTNGAHL